MTSVCGRHSNRQTYILIGDLNLDRMRPERREGKLLTDLEEVYGLECMITRVGLFKAGLS